jgi:hypothetical protein
VLSLDLHVSERDGVEVAWKGSRRAVPAEALRPGDRVAGRVVEEMMFSAGTQDLCLKWTDGTWDSYPPGTLVLLDGDDA